MEPISQQHVDFGEFLSELRLRNSVPLRAFVAVGANEPSLSRLENGLRNPTDRDLEAYAEVCLVDLNDLQARASLVRKGRGGPRLTLPDEGGYMFRSVEHTHVIYGQGELIEGQSTRVVQSQSDALAGVRLGLQPRPRKGDVEIEYDGAVGAEVRLREKIGNYHELWVEFADPLTVGDEQRFRLSYTVRDPDLSLVTAMSLAPAAEIQDLVIQVQFDGAVPKAIRYFRGLPQEVALLELVDANGRITEGLTEVDLDRFGFHSEREANVAAHVACGYCWTW